MALVSDSEVFALGERIDRWIFSIQAYRYLRGINLEHRCAVPLIFYQKLASHGEIFLFHRFAARKKRAVVQ